MIRRLFWLGILLAAVLGGPAGSAPAATTAPPVIPPPPDNPAPPANQAPPAAAAPSKGAPRTGAAPAAPAPPARKGADFSDEAIVVESLRTVGRFESDGTATSTVQTRVRLQKEGALREMGQIVIPYNADVERLTIKGRVIKKAGTANPIPDSAVQEVTSAVTRVAPMYSDMREKHLIVPGLEVGDTLEYEMQYVRFSPLISGHFWEAFTFERRSIVLDEELTIDVPAARFVNVKSKPELTPIVHEADGRRVYTWKSAHLVREDPDSAATKARGHDKKEDDQPSVQISTFKSWEEIGEWYSGLEGDRIAPDDKIRDKAAEIVKGRTDELAKLQALYDSVAQKYRYVALMFGAGRYQPHPAAEIFANQYGDCKDKHTLLAAMASAAGLHVHAALASVERKVDEAFPSPAQFDHVITYAQIGGQDVWLDTTTELAPFRMLVAPLRGKPALVISADGKSALRKVPKESAVANVVTREVDGTINGIGTLDADIKVAMRGDIELLGRIALRALPQPRWKELVQLVAPTAGSAEEISNLTISEIGDTSVPLEFDFHVTRLNYFSRFGSAPILFLPIGVIFAGDAETPAGTDPIDLFARKVEYHARLRLPAQFTPRLPVPVEVKRDYAEYASKYALQEGLLTVDRTLNVKVEDLPASRANDLEAFRRAVTTDERQMVAMQVGAGGGADDLVGLKSDDLLQAGQAAYDSGDYQTAADLASRVVKSEPKHNSAWADLGRAYVASGEMEEAESALKTAVEINPYSPDAYDNLGRVYIAKRRTGEAEKAFRKQIEINPLDEWAHRLLGHLLLQRKDYAGAAAELEKAVAIDGKDAEPFLDLGRAQIGLDKVREAGESFDRAVELKPDPEVWNEIAYALADHKTGLDKAQQYAESAVASVTAYLRNVHLPDLRPQDLAQVALLGACWDTLGWIRFRRGETTSAEKYLLASWQLTQAGAVADHLGRLYDSRSKNAQAIEYYAFANVAPKPETGSRSRLFELAGNLQANQVLTQKHDLVPNLRSFTVPGMSASGSAEFFVVIGPGSKVEDVRFISGDNALKPLAPALKRVDYKVRFPDANETQIVRRGILVCGPKGQGAKSGGGSCDFILLLPADVHSVD